MTYEERAIEWMKSDARNELKKEVEYTEKIASELDDDKPKGEGAKIYHVNNKEKK